MTHEITVDGSKMADRTAEPGITPKLPHIPVDRRTVLKSLAAAGGLGVIGLIARAVGGSGSQPAVIPDETPEPRPTRPATSIASPTGTATATQEPTGTPTVQATDTPDTTPTPEYMPLRKEGLVAVRKDWLLGGDLAIDQTAGDTFYTGFITALAVSEPNKEYFAEILSPGQSLIDYLRAHDYCLGPTPTGKTLKFPISDKPGYADFYAHPDVANLRLDGFRTVVFDRDEVGANDPVVSYVESLRGPKLLLSGSSAHAIFGIRVDENNRLVFVSGNKRDPSNWSAYANSTLGGYDGKFESPRDPKIATAHLLSMTKIFNQFITGHSRTTGVIPLYPDTLGCQWSELPSRLIFNPAH